MKKRKLILLGSLLNVLFSLSAQDQQKAPAPLYRCPIYDGAADPTLIFNNEEKVWWLTYTQRRANQDGADVAYCFGTKIGVASTPDNGKTWIYRGALDLDFEKGNNTLWAPEVVFSNGTYHLFLAYMQGTSNHWCNRNDIVHYTSKDMWKWKFEGKVFDVPSGAVIDPCLIQLPDGRWKMWYISSEKEPLKKHGVSWSITMSAISDDLYSWKVNPEPAIYDRAHEAPKVFSYKGKYWMIVDIWAGFAVYTSDNADKWTFNNVILDKPGSRTDDKPSGGHCDAKVIHDRAYIFYHTHPGRKNIYDSPADENGIIPYSYRRSSIQVAELGIEDNKLVVLARDKPFNFYLK